MTRTTMTRTTLPWDLDHLPIKHGSHKPPNGEVQACAMEAAYLPMGRAPGLEQKEDQAVQWWQGHACPRLRRREEYPMRERDRVKLQKALQTIRDPDGTGRTRVSAGWTGDPMVCLRCHLPTPDQASGVNVPPGPRCACPADSWSNVTPTAKR